MGQDAQQATFQAHLDGVVDHTLNSNQNTRHFLPN